jgi:hypothetical protein
MFGVAAASVAIVDVTTHRCCCCLWCLPAARWWRRCQNAKQTIKHLDFARRAGATIWICDADTLDIRIPVYVILLMETTISESQRSKSSTKWLKWPQICSTRAHHIFKK